MIGDKLVIGAHHTARATDIVGLLLPELQGRTTLSVAGESGSGKSETAHELARLFSERGIASAILQQDDYFVFPPKTNHAMRKRNLEQVGPYEVKLDFLDSNLRSFRRGESPIYKPLVDYDADRIGYEEMDLEGVRVVIAEGTYTSLLRFVDWRIFLARDYHATLEARKARARDSFEPFVVDVLEREHRIIAAHRELANLVVDADYERIARQTPAASR